MEQKIKPSHMSDEEWTEEYHNIAESDVEIPASEYGEYLQPILEDIVHFAEVGGVKIPTIIIEIAGMSMRERYAFAFWIGRTEYELQQWHGETKMQIASEMSQR